jgi:hypothetical protein
MNNQYILFADSMIFYENGRNRSVEYQGAHYQKLMEIYPLIKNQPDTLATVTNFLFEGREYELIFNPEKFKQEYDSIIFAEKKFKVDGPRSIDWGFFDVSEIAFPQWRDEEKFIFYLWNTSVRIPYRAVCIFEADPKISYECLPYRE